MRFFSPFNISVGILIPNGLAYFVAWLITGNDTYAAVGLGLSVPPLVMFMTINGIYRKIYNTDPDIKMLRDTVNKLLSK